MSAAALPLGVAVTGADPGPGVDTYVLIHGYGASAFTWRYWAPRLAERGHVLSLDLKGFGRALKPHDGRYAPADQAGLVHRLILERDLRSLTLVGHSLGGGIALLTALRLLDDGEGRLRRVVLAAGAAYEQRMPPFVGLARHPTLATTGFRLLGAHRVVRTVLQQIVYDRSGITHEQVNGYAAPLGTPEAVRALLETARQILPADLETIAARYRELDVPALLLWGERDRVVPLAVGERLARELPRAELHILARCGHLPAEERPEESFALLERFLDQERPEPA